MTEVICKTELNGVETNGVAEAEDQTASVRDIFKKITQGSSHDKVLDKVEVIYAGNGRFIGEMVIEPQHTNVYGSLHGGFTATLIDICTSIAMSTHPRKGNGVSVDLNISYLKPGLLNERIVIKADTIRVGKTMGFSEAVITNKATGDILAKGMHTKYVDSVKYAIK